MMIITDCNKCGKDYMYDPNMQPQYQDECQECKEEGMSDIGNPRGTGQDIGRGEGEYTANGMFKKGQDPEVTCWHCKKTFLCDCMDATCRLCGAPYKKSRCKEFNFIPKEMFCRCPSCGDKHTKTMEKEPSAEKCICPNPSFDVYDNGRDKHEVGNWCKRCGGEIKPKEPSAKKCMCGSSSGHSGGTLPNGKDLIICNDCRLPKEEKMLMTEPTATSSIESVNYVVSLDKGMIRVSINKEGNLTILTYNQQEKFLFRNSNPAMVRSVALMMLKAVELAEDTKIKSGNCAFA